MGRSERQVRRLEGAPHPREPGAWSVKQGRRLELEKSHWSWRHLTWESTEESSCIVRVSIRWKYKVRACSVTSVVSDSLRHHGLQPTRLLCPWASPGKNTGVGCHALLQGIFPTQGSNQSLSCLLHWHKSSLSLDHHPFGKPRNTIYSEYTEYQGYTMYSGYIEPWTYNMQWRLEPR